MVSDRAACFSPNNSNCYNYSRNTLPLDHARDLRLNPDNYRILCRNGTLASRTGFIVDEDCYLTTIVDSEVVVRQSNSSVTDIINTLLSLDRYFIRDPQFKMYNIHGGIKNLIFKVSCETKSPTSNQSES